MANKKKEKIKVDIILPNYNSSNYIIKTVNSILNQSYKNWKLIIVDDNSNEETVRILKKNFKNKNIKIYFLKKNRGAGFCRNYAIKKSSSPYLAFIDSDDIWEREKLKKQINFMKKNNYSFSYTDYVTFGDKNREIKTPKKINFSNFIKNTAIATSTMIVKRDKIKNIKFTDSKICEDYYFKCKLLKKVKYAYCLKKNLTKYRVRKNSLQSSNLQNIYWIYKINREYNKLNFIDNIISLLNISFNSLKKYRGKNIF